MSRGVTWLHLSSLCIVFLTISGFSLKLFEFPLEIKSILLLRGFLNVNSVGQPSRSISFTWARFSGEMWSFTADSVLWASRVYPVYYPPKKCTNLPGSSPKMDHCHACHLNQRCVDVFLLFIVIVCSMRGEKLICSHLNNFGVTVEEFSLINPSFFRLWERWCSLTTVLITFSIDSSDTRYHLSKAGFIRVKSKFGSMVSWSYLFLLETIEWSKSWPKTFFMCVKNMFLLFCSFNNNCFVQSVGLCQYYWQVTCLL